MVFLSEVTYTATAAQTDFSITFPVLRNSHVQVTIDGTNETDFTVNSGATALTFGGTVTLAGGEAIRIRRVTPNTVAGQLVDFQKGVAITETAMDDYYKQLLFVVQEAFDAVTTAELANGNLPTVTTGDNDDSLYVVAGAWALRTPAEAREILDIDDHETRIAALEGGSGAASAVAPVFRGAMADLTLVVDLNATWWQNDSNTIPYSGLREQYKNNPALVGASTGTDQFTVQAGLWKATVQMTMKNTSNSAEASPIFELVQDPGGGSEARRFLMVQAMALRPAASSTDESTTHLTRSAYFNFTGETNVKLRGKVSAGTCQCANIEVLWERIGDNE